MVKLENISISFGARDLFKDISISIGIKDKIGLIGVNGSGKSTLFKIISKNLIPDKGKVILSKHTTVGYLPQDGLEVSGTTLYDSVYNSAGNISEIEKEINEIENEIRNFKQKDSEEYLDLLQQYSELQDRFNLLEGYKLEGKIIKILKGLGFKESEFDKSISELSEGFKMRVALAKLLIFNPSLLLLDEPTNHLDFDSLIWLEEYLKEYNGSYIIISHERNFLNNLVKKVFELSNGNINEYSGNYDFYEKQKILRIQQQENEMKNRLRYIKQQERFIERFRYKATKASAVQSRIKLLQKLQPIEKELDEKQIDFNFPPAIKSGKVILDVINLCKTYDGENYILENINFSIARGEKVAVLGANGAGKSTLVRIIAGKENYQKGDINFGYNVVMQYYSQNQLEELDTELTVLETLQKVADNIPESSLRNILGSFLFTDDDVFKYVRVLSGGEKSRLSLAKMLVSKSNFLILDEPTNHLDIRSKSVLKNALLKYEGAALIVSHDRDFLSGLTEKILEVKDKGIRMYLYNIDEYSLIKREEILSQITQNHTEESSKRQTKNDSLYLKGLEIKARKKEISKKINQIKKVITLIENEIISLECRKKEIESLMTDDNIYKKVSRLIELKKEYSEIIDKLDALNSNWNKSVDELENLNKQLLLIK
ncbi:MAG: ABC-F family ATP-binding cassette domain-containing protein [Ignavibacteria bacterium]|nr:ABC-F family ATP-binding cassette domain-containing protein [Ignavibacteria bacterium]